MNEMASQVIGGAVSQLQVLEIHSFLWTPCRGRNAGGKERTNQQT